MERIIELADQLRAGPLVADEFGDDVGQAAIALQALTVVLVQRDMRTKMRWETIRDERGRLVQRLRPDQPPTPEEAEREGKGLAAIIETGEAPAVQIWDPDSVRVAAGRPMGRAEYKAHLARTGREEVSGYDIRNDTTTGKVEKRYSGEEVKQEIERAIRHGLETGQFRRTADGVEAVPNAPVVPMPVVEKPSPVRQKPLIDPGAGAAEVKPPMHESIPLAKRTPVNTDAMMANFYQRAKSMAIAKATQNGAAAMVGGSTG